MNVISQNYAAAPAAATTVTFATSLPNSATQTVEGRLFRGR